MILSKQEKRFFAFFDKRPELKPFLLDRCVGCNERILTKEAHRSTFKHRILWDQVDNVDAAAWSFCGECYAKANRDPAFNNECNRKACRIAGVDESKVPNQFDLRESDYVNTDPTLRRLHESLLEACSNRPWIVEGMRRYQVANESGMPWVLRTPADVFTEKALAALCLLGPNVEVVAPSGEDVDVMMRVQLAQYCEAATPVLWEESVHASAREMTVPPCAWNAAAIDPPIQYWTWPREWISKDGGRRVQGMLVIDSNVLHAFHHKLFAAHVDREHGETWPTQRWTQFFFLSNTPSNTLEVSFWQVLHGTEFPGAYDYDTSGDEVEFARVVFSMTAFMNSPYIPQERVGPPRAMRKEATRKHGITEFPEARFLTLRKIRKQTEHAERDDAIGAQTAKAREYTRSWLISGYLRNQRYGVKLGQTKLIYIAPSIARPDLPFVPRAERVAR